jgi:uncharacterized protein
VAGLLSGTLGTATGMAGPPLVLLFISRDYQPHAFRGTISASFYALGALTLTMFVIEGFIGRSDLVIMAALLPAAFAGTIAGQRALRRVTPHQFERIVLILLFISGLAGTVEGLRRMIS